MQYYTFLGLGDAERGYSETHYNYKNTKMCSKFVQEVILKHFQNEIDQIFVFVTKESKERFSNEFSNMVRKFGFDDKNIFFVDIDYGISFDGFVAKMLEILNDYSEFIIDITHSFRNIPMKLLFSLGYIEKTKKSKLIHLFYGMKLNDNGEIIDFIDDYKLQGLSNLLQQFDQTLKISLSNYKDYINEDKNIENLTTAMEGFNRVIEFCEFDCCLESIRKISEFSRCIIKQSDNYTLIIPLLSEIQKKLDVVNKEKNNILKKIEFIKLLLNHGLYQVAITFTDQFFREELIRRILAPEDFKFNMNDYLRKKQIKSPNFVYELSQILKNDYIKNNNNKALVKNGKKYEGLIKENQINLDALLVNSKNMGCCIKRFDDEIRNKINHGKSISISEEKMIEIINDVLKEIAGGIK